MAEVTFRDVSKSYGPITVIDRFSIEIEDEEFMVLVGPSGCGKSTALRMIAGLEEITAGTISIGGRVVNDLPPKDRDIAMVFQTYALYPHMSVRENLEFGLKLRRVDPGEIRRLVGEAAEILGIGHLLGRKPKELSGGQRQRVAVGRAIVRKPAVFLFDEPLSNLDAKLRVQMRAELTRLQDRLRTTTIYVTHDQVEAMTMGRRIAVMNEGRLQQVGAPLAVYEEPANLFVASFIGTPPMNLLALTIANGGGTLASSEITLPVPRSLSPITIGREGRGVVAGIRPENILGPGTPARGEATELTAEVQMVEPLGHEAIVHGRIGSKVLVAKLEPHDIPRMGDRIQLTVELDRLHLFDAESGLRLSPARALRP